jgi:adenosylcobinamide-GDP ribazoletransferase
MRRFIIALQFLTVIPFDEDLRVTEEDLGKSMVYFPLAGLFIGGCLIFSNQLLSSILPRSVVDGLLITILVLLTGSMHLDALADTIDGVTCGRNKAEKLEIMKDGKVGAMGVVGIVLVLILKYVAISALPQTLKYQSLLLMPMMGRWSQVTVAYFSDYAGLKRGLGFPFTTHVTIFIAIFTTAMVFLFAYLFLLLKGILIAGIIWLFCFLYSQSFKRILGGVTGDILGAVNEVVEVAVLVMILVRI